MNRETSWNLEILNSKGRREDFHYQRGSCDVLSCLEVLYFIEGSCSIYFDIPDSKFCSFAALIFTFYIFRFNPYNTVFEDRSLEKIYFNFHIEKLQVWRGRGRQITPPPSSNLFRVKLLKSIFSLFSIFFKRVVL